MFKNDKEITLLPLSNICLYVIITNDGRYFQKKVIANPNKFAEFVISPNSAHIYKDLFTVKSMLKILNKNYQNLEPRIIKLNINNTYEEVICKTDMVNTIKIKIRELKNKIKKNKINYEYYNKLLDELTLQTTNKTKYDSIKKYMRFHLNMVESTKKELEIIYKENDIR